MAQAKADGGQVAPGTQIPIQIFFVVSRTDAEDAEVGEYTVDRLSDLFAGTRESPRFNGKMGEEFAIFTDRTSADQFADRQKLIFAGIRSLELLAVDQLKELVPAIAPAKAEDTIESINRYTE